MSEYLAPGVYVEEIDTGNKPIEGVATSTAGFLGIAERGPTEPMLITSFGEYVRTYGRYVEDRYLTYAVEGFFQNGGKRCFVVRVTAADAVEALLTIDGLQITAIGDGTWANKRVAIRVSNAGLDSDGALGLFKLTVIYWDSTVALQTPFLDPTDPENTKTIRENKQGDATIIEVFDNLSSDPKSSSFYERRLKDRSSLITVQQVGDGRPGNTSEIQFLDGGTEGSAITVERLKGDPSAEPGKKLGLAALEEVDEIAILCCPEEGDDNLGDIREEIVTQCENLKDRFAIIQSKKEPLAIKDHRPLPRASKYSAYYYPWIEVRHPVKGIPVLIPPGGHLAGIYARTDIERGVHKAPANELIRGLDLGPDGKGGLQVQVPKGQQDLLNPRGVNVLRYFPGRGNLVWGARTSADDPDWKYINVRRLFIFVEESIEEATQWAVFEPNDEPLWARLRRSVSDFLTRLWMDGMLQGATKDQAYFVRCDRSTMTQADIDNGRLIMLIGIAPVKPAEFVIFRIGQWSGGSEVQEG